MANTGVKYPSSGSTASSAVTPYDDTDWTNASYAASDDTSYATITTPTYDTGKYSYLIKARGFDLSSIPSGSTIDGIVVEVLAWAPAGAADYACVQLLDASGNLTGSNYATGNLAGSIGSPDTWGGSSDKWGLGASLTESLVKDADFGVGLSIVATADNTDISVDYIRITVYYTEPVVSVTTQPSPITGTFSTQAQTTSGAALTVQSALQASFSVLDPTKTGTALAQPSAIQGTLSVPSNPSSVVSTVYVPSHISAQGSTVDCTAGSIVSVTVTPEPIAGVFSAIAATIAGWATKVVDTISGALSALAPVVAASCLVAVSPIAAQVQAQDPSIVGYGQVSSGYIGGLLSAIDPAVSGSAIISVEPIGGEFSSPDPTAGASSPDKTVVVDPISGQFSVPDSPEVSVSTVYVPSEITGQFSQEDPSVQIQSGSGVTVQPEHISGQLEIVGATAAAGATVLVGYPDGYFSMPNPTIVSTIAVTVQVDVIGGTLSPVSPTLYAGNGATITPEPISGQFTIADSPSEQITTTYVPSEVYGLFSQDDPSVSADKNVVVQVDCISAQFLVSDYFEADVSAELGVDPEAGSFSTPSVSTALFSWSTPGTYSWECPAGLTYITVKVWGGGGAGGNGAAGGGGGGGGSGAYASSTLNVTPGVTYALRVGGASEESWFYSSTHTQANGGNRGGNADSDSAGSGGTGGLAGHGDTTTAGVSGEDGDDTAGGQGGDAPNGGLGGAGGVGGNGSPGEAPGGGGGGGGRYDYGGAGASGMVYIEWATLVATPSPTVGQFSAVAPTVSGSCVIVPSPIGGTFSAIDGSTDIDLTQVKVEPTTGQFSVPSPTVVLTGNITVSVEVISGKFQLYDPKVFRYARMWVKAGGKWRVVGP